MRTLALFALVGICVLAFALNASALVVTLITDRYVGDRDFVTYWAAAQQLVKHRNPYAINELLGIERQAGFPSDRAPMVMRNAPPALLIVLPLGWLPLRFASTVWGILLVGALWISIRMIARLYGGNHSPLTLIACAFAPTLSCLIAGQMSIFGLLGLVLFLTLEPDRPFLAGASLWLCALKPQVFVLAAVAFFLWTIWTKRYQVIGGLLAAVILSTSCVMMFDHPLWTEYAQMMRQQNIPNLLIPCLSSLLRLAIDPARVWIQLIPVVAGCVWAFWYFVHHRHDWNWREHGAALVLGSVLVAPYSWFVDQSVLLPFLMKQIYSSASAESISALALLSAGLEFADLRGVPLGNMVLYSSTAAWWLLWYLWTIYENGLGGALRGISQEQHEIDSV